MRLSEGRLWRRNVEASAPVVDQVSSAAHFGDTGRVHENDLPRHIERVVPEPVQLQVETVPLIATRKTTVHFHPVAVCDIAFISNVPAVTLRERELLWNAQGGRSRRFDSPTLCTPSTRMYCCD